MFWPMHIHPFTVQDLPKLLEHRLRHSKENGSNGDIIFFPGEEILSFEQKDVDKMIRDQEKPLSEPGWRRTWALTDGVDIFGEITLANSPALKSASHRALLMIGLERSVRNKGFGSQLITQALDWARGTGQLEWISLNVFENNPVAKRLYQKFGFQTVGTRQDMFRVFGKSIDDTEMVLKLHPKT